MKNYWNLVLCAATIVVLVSNQQISSISKQTTTTKYSSTDPVYAASLVLDDKILRLNTCIFKNITLPFTKEYYDSNDIQVIGTISETVMDQNFAYQIQYQIVCHSTCIIDFTLSRFTQHVSQNFQYYLVIDFLVAANLQVSTLNMTSNKVDYNIEQFGLKEGEVFDDFQMMFVPNGFNHISMTGYIKYQPLRASNRIILEYDNNDNSNGVWILNKNFIFYKIVLIPRSHKLAQSQCQRNSFKGLLSTKQKSIEINLHSAKKYTNFKALELPLICSDNFKDERKPIQRQTLISQSIVLTQYFIIIALFLVAEIAYLFYRKKFNNQLNKNAPKLPQMIISFDASHIITVSQGESIEPKVETQPNSDKIVEIQ